jgi:hypothetical protein
LWLNTTITIWRESGNWLPGPDYWIMIIGS